VRNTSLIAIALLIEFTPAASSPAQEKCEREAVEVTANAEDKVRLEELQHEMKLQFTFTIPFAPPPFA
jgi:hypothetical protein